FHEGHKGLPRPEGALEVEEGIGAGIQALNGVHDDPVLQSATEAHFKRSEWAATVDSRGPRSLYSLYRSHLRFPPPLHIFRGKNRDAGSSPRTRVAGNGWRRSSARLGYPEGRVGSWYSSWRNRKQTELPSLTRKRVRPRGLCCQFPMPSFPTTPPRSSRNPYRLPVRRRSL